MSSCAFRVFFDEGACVVELGDVLKAIGPNAAIVFAAWIFMGFLQQRYDSAVDRYREAVGDYRSNDHPEERAGNLRDQILTYVRRCRLMGWATLVGLLAAILLIGSLILGAIDVIVPHNPLVAGAGIATLVGGFVLVIAAAVIVIAEGRIVHRQLQDELRDVPDLADQAGRGGRSVR
jgi:uncharacterized membrane protein YraQ (UPF0718 family)